MPKLRSKSRGKIKKSEEPVSINTDKEDSAISSRRSPTNPCNTSKEESENEFGACDFIIDRTSNSTTDVHLNLDSGVNSNNGPVTSCLFSSETVTNSDDQLQSSESIQDVKQSTSTQRPVSEKKNSKGKNKLGLSTSLQDGGPEDLYITGNRKRKPAPLKVESSVDELLKKSVLPKDVEKLHCLPPYEISLNQTRKQRQKERSQTKGKQWFDMKAPEMTEQKKNDLSVLQMRRVLDPKHFYKNPDIRALPKFFQMGTIVEDASEFYSARVPKKQRKKTLVDELLEDTDFRRYNKKKYMEITQKVQNSSARKGAAKHMKRLKKGRK